MKTVFAAFSLFLVLSFAAALGQTGPTFTNSIGMEFVRIPAGTFQMGIPDIEGPCSSCNGKGKKVENRPAGTTERRCTRCAGKGETICDGINGRPHYVNNYNSVCTKCNGTGRMICPACSGAGFFKDTKYVESYGPCSHCQGTGKKELSEREKDEGPRHAVTLSRPFYLGKFEVTQAQWKAVMGNNPSEFQGENLPVEKVSWNDAQEFVHRLNAREGTNVYRLPTEAEWEYACRAGTTTHFHYGNSLGSHQANFNGNSPYGRADKGVYREKTTPVGSFSPNAWSLYDMHGNVAEWCADWFGPYSAGSVKDPTGPAAGARRVYRGGSWNYDAQFCRSAFRGEYVPVYRDYHSGFRLAGSLP